MRLYGKAPSPKGVRLYTRSMQKGSNIFYILKSVLLKARKKWIHWEPKGKQLNPIQVGMWNGAGLNLRVSLTYETIIEYLRINFQGKYVC